jgi:peptidoglycan/LPS O-acetylase OafA/YrhL
MRHPSTSGRFSAGDALRGLSALGVMGLHITEFALGGSTPIVGDVFVAMRGTYGAIGFLALAAGAWLSVFFVLSGYLISRPFVASYVRDESRPPVGRYARNRVLRIVPAFWVAVLATLVVFGLSGSSPWVVPLTLGFGQVFAPAEPFVTHISQGWTLGAEMAFYALVPAVALCWGRSPSGTRDARGRRLLALCLAIAVGSIAWRTLDSHDVTWIEVFPGVAAAFVPGVALAAVEATWPERLAAPMGRRLAAPLALAGVALFGAAAASGQYVWWRWLAQVAGGGLLVAGALLREWSGAPAWKLLRNRATEWLGARSYSVYVLHFGIALWIADHLAVSGHPWQTLLRVAPLSLAITLLASDLSWRWVERPFLRLKRSRVAPAPSAAPPALAPARPD